MGGSKARSLVEFSASFKELAIDGVLLNSLFSFSSLAVAVFWFSVDGIVTASLP